MSKSKKQVYISFNDGKYRVYKSHDTISVTDDNGFYHIVCTGEGTERHLYLNKNDIIFIDIGDVVDAA